MSFISEKNSPNSEPAHSARSSGEGYSPAVYLLAAVLTAAVFLMCLCIGSVDVSLTETLRLFYEKLTGSAVTASVRTQSIILSVRLPRIICVALTGASLSLCGAAMQGLLKNPLADGSTLGVSSGASLGAVLAIALGISFPGLPLAGTTVCAIAAAFISLVIILSLAWSMDHSLSTNTIILIGTVYSMLMSSCISLILAMASDRDVKTITFWTMGSLSSVTMEQAALLSFSLAVCAAAVCIRSRELNAMAIGEDNARSIGVDVNRIRLLVLICTACLIGVCVSIGGTIGFVGLVVPHMTRAVTGPNHIRLLPASMFAGAIFLMLADLAARILLKPLELPIGVVTSFVGALLFMSIYYRMRKGKL